MEVTRKDGLGWEADLPAHVSMFSYYLPLFSTLSYITYFEENNKVAKL